MSWLIFLIAAYWLVRGADGLIGLRRYRHLPCVTEEPEVGWPKVSIIFAARDEADSVGPALKSMLSLDYPDYEVIAVNDRSTDGTRQKIEAHADRRLKAINISCLPEGWLGKNHALFEGYRAASGKWLLFTDADVFFEPSALRRAIGYAQRESRDHLSLFPKLVLHGYLENVFTSYFALIFNLRFRPWAASSRRSRAYVGIGAFNLVGREAYEKAGTHRALAMDVADDMILGQRIKRAGFRQEGLFGYDAIRVRWVSGFGGVLNSLHKNAFRGLNYNFLYLVAASAGLLIADVLPFAVLLWAPDLFWPALVSVFMIFLLYLSAGGESLRAFPAHPLASLLFLFILWRSALSAICRGGVRWRETFYPIKKLAKTPL